MSEQSESATEQSETRTYRGIALDICIGAFVLTVVHAGAYALGKLGRFLFPEFYGNPSTTAWILIDGLLTIALVLFGFLFVLVAIGFTAHIGRVARSTWRLQ